MTTKIFNLFATTPKGLELLLVDELRTLGAKDPAEKLAGVTFTGDLELAYKACLWSRLANRILLRLSQISAPTPEALYAGVQTINWEDHLNPSNTLNVNFTTSQSKITHSLFGAQKVKDAIVDQLRKKYQERPNVARENADVNVNVYLYRDMATISIDLSGESLHKRGYRLEHGAAPLKENLAAAILMRAGWKNTYENGGMLLDPMCGSGTFLIEAALMAGDIAPGLLHDYFGFIGWKQHNPNIWNNLLTEAKKRRDEAASSIPTIIGYDKDPHAIKVAFANIERAGFLGKIHVEKKDITQVTAKQPHGLLVVNPPYGERLGEMPELPILYEHLGAQLKKEFAGWKAAVFTGNPELGKVMGLRSNKQYALFNGPIPCQLLLFDVQPDYFIDRSPEANNDRRIRKAQQSLTEADQQAAQMVANRICKNMKNLKSWVQRENTSCYRVYDADLPEYAVSIDIYNDSVLVQEYPAPKTVDKYKAEQRLQQIFAILPDALGISAAKIYFKSPTKISESGDKLIEIAENHVKYLINLSNTNYDVGLRLEQRNLRLHMQKIVNRKNFLSLFTHSGDMTVCAASGKALTTKSIVENKFYASWVQRNLELNGFAGQTTVANIFEWILKEQLRYDVIFAELPDSTFHLSHEHPDLIQTICKLLAPRGELYLVTRDSRFKLPPMIKAENIASKMLPHDFMRNPKVQQCWKIS